jgi:hypothetical protein
MKQRNYATACIGKWGLGRSNLKVAPNKQGFDYFFFLDFKPGCPLKRLAPQTMYENAEKLAFNKRFILMM